MGEGKPSSCLMRILLVEDDRLVRQSLELILGHHGWDVVSFPSGEEAISALSDIPYRLAIVDFFMHGMNGAEVTRHLKKHSTAPVFMLTGCIDPETGQEALRAGVDRVFYKPVQTSTLIRALEEFGSP